MVPVVCFASDTFAEDVAQCGPVRILNANAVEGWLSAQPEILLLNDAARMAQLMETRK